MAPRSLTARLQKVETNLSPMPTNVEVPNRPLSEWTDDELHAVLEATDPGLLAWIKSASDAELLDLIEASG